jgi:predicted transcriptional regulator
LLAGDADFSGRRKLDERKLSALVQLILEERLSVRQAADALGVSHMTAYRALSQIEYNPR